ncbi:MULTISPECIES: DUF488 domain-containing protein [unclassified Hoeflea]|jgi:uncharacterized protein YeaO (DUF488 family)|uniref:DUF488 domain-containing protein n=1 Tax=unclassified Hoeflea TaxID=2614931 RepID=UPI002AFE59DE|nr:DUF488 family protein [Hoeflea sp.]
MSQTPDLEIARIHDDAAQTKGARILVDRLWPRGVSKVDAKLDDWIRESAPSNDLRRWFAHDPAKWETFRSRYLTELDANPEPIERLLDWCRKGPVTLLFAARDREYNQAVVLRDYLRERLAQTDGLP